MLSRINTFNLALMALLLITGAGMANAQELKDWEGNYRGFIDGRPSTLRIEVGSHAGRTPLPRGCVDRVRNEDDIHAYIFVVLRDLDRGTVWSRCLDQFGKDGPDGQRWRKLKLFNHNTEKKDKVGTFYLHTWDTDFISGWKKWRGERYGRLFVRVGRDLPTCRFPSLGYIHAGGVPVVPDEEPDCDFR